MKFNVSSSKLFQQLQAVSRVIASKNSLPILDCVLFDLQGNALTLTASDSETTIRTTIDVENASGEGKVAFGAKLLLDTLKEFSDQPLTFNIDDQNFGLNITSVNGNYSFIGQNGNEYPLLPGMTEESGSFTIAANTLLTSINKTIFCTAEDELRPVMNGIFFDMKDSQFTLVATDAHRLVRYTNTSVQADVPANFILPKKPALLLKNVLAKEQEDIVVTFSSKNAMFEFGRTLIVCRLIEGNYPNYRGVIPSATTKEVTINRADFLNACKRVSVFANNGTALLKLALSSGQINISAQDIDFSTSAEETLACDYAGDDMSIGFKAPFLIEILSNLTSEEVIIKLIDPARAGLLLPKENEEDEDLLMLLMPLLLND